MVGIVFKIIFGTLCVIGTLGYFKAFASIVRLHLAVPDTFLAFGVGALIYTVLWIFVFAKREKFWAVLEHEMTHALFAVLFFKKVHSVSASRGIGGSIEIEGDNFVIALAPYFFPILSIFIVLIKPSILVEYQWIMNGLLGFTLMFHIVHLMKEFHPAQPDLKKSGMLFSVIVVGFFNLFFIGVSIASLQGDWTHIGDFVRLGFSESGSFVTGIWTRAFSGSFSSAASF